MIKVNKLSKSFRVHEKTPGLKGSFASLFHRKWRTVNALKEVSLEIASGEIVGLIGANGAGKTTLVKILAGIIHPTSGDVSVLGFNPWLRQNDYKRQIALVMGQKAQLWWDLPAADCFLLLKEIYGVSEKDYRERLDFLATALQVQNLLNIQVRRLSLGERMKMELIATLLHQPKVVFLDEPTLGLDINAQIAIREFLLNYRQLHNSAMIITSHYMEDIKELCKRIIIIRDGEFIYDGGLDTVLKEYGTHKLLIAHLPNEDEVFKLKQKVASFDMEVLESEKGALRLMVKRTEVSQAAAFVLQNAEVHDFSVEEQPISEVIRIIMEQKEL